MKNRLISTMMISAIVFLAPSCNSFAQQPDEKSRPSQSSGVYQPAVVDLTYAAEQALNTVVYIKVTINGKEQVVTYQNPFDDFFGDFFGFGNGGKQQRKVQTPKRQAAGSGVILTEDGYIVTNNHVVDGADEILVKMNDNREFKARIIGTDQSTDLALIKVESDEKLPAIKVADSDKIKVGEWVLAIGNPFGLTSTVTAGIVSAKARSLGTSPNSIESFIQTDAAINSGNSGGALVNARGELVGINAMLYSQTGSYAGYGFAIPTSIMNKVVADLKKYGTVQRALLGIAGTEVSNYIHQQKEKGKDVDFGTVNGIYVNEVVPESAADAAGLKEGDVIISVAGRKVTKMSELQEIMLTHRPGDKIKLTYLRDKKEHTANVTLLNAQGTEEVIEGVDADNLGAALRPLKDAEKKELGLTHGLLVSAVKDGKMKEAGITKGLIIMNVNDQDMKTMTDWEEVLKKANMSKERVLWIRAKTQSGLNKAFIIELSNEKENKK